MLSHLILESPGEGDRAALLAVLKLRSGRWGGRERTGELEQPSNQKQAQDTRRQGRGMTGTACTRGGWPRTQAKQTGCLHGQVPLGIGSPPQGCCFRRAGVRSHRRRSVCDMGRVSQMVCAALLPTTHSLPSGTLFTVLGPGLWHNRLLEASLSPRSEHLRARVLRKPRPPCPWAGAPAHCHEPHVRGPRWGRLLVFRVKAMQGVP